VFTVYRLITQKHNDMSNFKIVIATQANSIYKHKNSKRKTLNCNSNIFVNQQCLKNYLVPNYENIIILINQLYKNTMGNLTLQLSLLVKPATSINTRKENENTHLQCYYFNQQCLKKTEFLIM
jgi:hypothetical protein